MLNSCYIVSNLAEPVRMYDTIIRENRLQKNETLTVKDNAVY